MAIQDKIEGSSYLYDILIIGAGPAALTAAIYGRNANLKVGFIEKQTPGGKIVNTSNIQNYPGFDLINGADLALKMFNQASSQGAEYMYGNVTNISNRDGYQIVSTEDGLTRYAKALIIASGMEERKLNIKGEQEYFHKGLSYCAICDGGLTKEKEVVVVGGGNSAIYNAVYLSNIAKTVTIIHRSDKFKSDEKILSIARNTKNIKIITNATVEEINGDGSKITNLLINENGKQIKINTEYVFVYIGFTPTSDFVPYKEILNKDGFINVTKDMSTSIPGLYAAGDVVNKSIRQITTAVNDGSVAALSAIEYIKINWK